MIPNCSGLNDVSTSTMIRAYVEKAIRPIKSRSEPMEVSYVVGTALFINRRAYNMLGGFDEVFYFYGEDVDFSLRARALGIKLYLIPNSVVLHRGSGTVGRQRGADYIYHSERGRLITFIRHGDAPSMAFILFFHALLALYYLAKRRTEGFVAVVPVYMDAVKSIRRLLTLRRIPIKDKHSLTSSRKQYIVDIIKMSLHQLFQ